MMRLVLLLLVFAALVLAATAVIRFFAALTTFSGPQLDPPRKEDAMPAVFRNLAYVLLLLLMLGISTGILGGL